MSENKIKTVVVLPIAAVGHSNPILASINELITEHKNKDSDTRLRVIAYSLEKYKKFVETTGAEFRAYSYVGDEPNDKIFNSKMDELLAWIMRIYQEMLEAELPTIVNEIEEAKPDLILFDNAGTHLKWFIKLLRKRYEEKNKSSEFPQIIPYATTFCSLKGVFPSDEQTNQFFGSQEMVAVYMKIDADYRKLAEKYGIPYTHPLEELSNVDEETDNLVYVCPELHPSSDRYPKNVKFVGASIESKVHIRGVETSSDDSVNYILNTFPSINPLKSIEEIYLHKHKKLILVSFGSILQNHMDLYSMIFKAIETFDEEPSDNSTKTGYRFKSDDLCVIMAVGEKCYNELKSGNIKVPNNVYYAPSVPQIEVLKRASLFITHNGMNSTSESVHIGVPMVCIPLTTDQPNVANRVVNEGLGLLLIYGSITYLDIRSAVHNILENPKFYERSIKFAGLSNKSIGQVEASKYIFSQLKI